MVFCNMKKFKDLKEKINVTILILIDGFLQFRNLLSLKRLLTGHNPYFNRWFSAIKVKCYHILSVMSHNPYFNRWFSAIKQMA